MKNKIRPYLLLTLVLVLIGIGAFFEFASSLFDKTKEDSKISLQTFVDNEVNIMDSELRAAVEQIQIIAAALADVNDFAAPEVLSRLQEYHNQTHFKRLLIAGRNGQAFDGVGTRYMIAFRPAVTRALMGETGIYEEQDVTGQKTIVLSSPIIKDGKVAGLVLGEYDIFALYQIINLENKEGTSYAALINSSGDFLIDANNDNQLVKGDNNLFKILKRVQFNNGNSLEQILERMALKKSGFSEYGTSYGSRLMYYKPLGVNDWFLVKVHTDKMIKSEIAPVKSMVQKFTLVLTVVLIFLAAIVYHGLYSLRQANHQQALRFKTVADNIPGGVAELFLGEEMQVAYANDAFYNLLDCPKEKFNTSPINGVLSRLWSQEEFAKLRTIVEADTKKKKIFNFEFSISDSLNQLKWLNLNGRVIAQTRTGFTVQAVLVDVTTEKVRTDAILEQSKLDDMTGLFNKTAAQQLVTSRVKEANPAVWGAFVVMDIDRFKGVNDHFGHLIGDEVICNIADVLKRFFQLPNVTGRVGGDEFIIYVDYVTGFNQISLLLHQVQGAIKALRFSNPGLHITCSMGCVYGPNFDHFNYEQIFALADKNLYMAKSKGRGGMEVSFLPEE